MQVVPDCQSRSALGETCDGGLVDIFARDFGPPGSRGFEAARNNFLRSEAGCAGWVFLAMGCICPDALRVAERSTPSLTLLAYSLQWQQSCSSRLLNENEHDFAIGFVNYCCAHLSPLR